MPMKPRKEQVEAGVWVAAREGQTALFPLISVQLDLRHFLSTGEARPILTIRQMFDHYKYEPWERERALERIKWFGEGVRWLAEDGSPLRDAPE